MSITAIGASFSFTSVRRIEASQPGRTREVEPVPPTQAAAAARDGAAETGGRASGVAPAALVAVQQQRDDDGSDRVREAARSYRG